MNDEYALDVRWVLGYGLDEKAKMGGGGGKLWGTTQRLYYFSVVCLVAF